MPCSTLYFPTPLKTFQIYCELQLVLADCYYLDEVILHLGEFIYPNYNSRLFQLIFFPFVVFLAFPWELFP